MGVIKSFEDYYGDRILAKMAQQGNYQLLLKACSIEEARRFAIEERRSNGQGISITDNVVRFPFA